MPETVLITEPSGCGKTHGLLHELLEKEDKGHVEFLLNHCPTLWFNSTYIPFGVPRKRYRRYRSRYIRPDTLNTLLQHIVDVYSGTRLAINIDDMSNSKD